MSFGGKLLARETFIGRTMNEDYERRLQGSRIDKNKQNEERGAVGLRGNGIVEGKG